MSPRTGRPPTGNPGLPLTIRVPADDRANWEAAAERAGKSLSSWMREKLNAAAKRAK